MREIFELQNITAGYDGNPVLLNARLTVYENDFIGIIGPNGGGKTTLLKVIVGLLRPFSGKVVFYNNFSSNDIGYLSQVTQAERAFPITAKQVVRSGLMSGSYAKGFFVKADHRIVENIMETVGIQNLAQKPVNNLSGGEFQKVMLCRAIISNPKLLILDEPNTFVDHNFEAEMHHILKKLNENMAIIMVSHDLGNISSLVKSIACVNRTLTYHHENKINAEMLEVYNCPVDLITHGHVPHRVLGEHGDEKQ
jgi:zinc transport system ATP-binding protein